MKMKYPESAQFVDKCESSVSLGEHHHLNKK